MWSMIAPKSGIVMRKYFLFSRSPSSRKNNEQSVQKLQLMTGDMDTVHNDCI